jgi:predicted Holliday junction resolvase-like endonuclease
MRDSGAPLIMMLVLVFIILTVSWMALMPRYRVWSQEMDGRAEFAKAEQNRKIKVEEAKANLEAERLNAEAEIVRAEGASKAIAIEQGALTETYIKYLWVRQQSANGEKTIIYLPSNEYLPVTEASRIR